MTFISMVGRPVTIGVVAGVGAKFLLGEDGSAIPFLGMEVSPMVAVGGAVGLASVGGELLSGYVLPMLPQSEGAEKMESMLLQPALTGAAALVVGKVCCGGFTDTSGMVKLFALGAASDVAGGYAWSMIDAFLEPEAAEEQPETCAGY